MVKSSLRKEAVRPVSAETVPEKIAHGLDASADDLRHHRIVDLDASLEEMEAELEAHLARRQTARPGG